MPRSRMVLFLIFAFVFGLLCCSMGCPVQEEKQPEVGNFIWGRVIYDPSDSDWPKVLEYTYNGSKKFIVFVKGESIFVSEE